MTSPGLHKDDRFGTTDSQKILHWDRSLTAYSQLVNLGSQAVVAGVRTQLIDDTLGVDTFTPKTLWSPVNNRINFLNANVGDYIDIDILISSLTSGSILQISVQLDYSPSLDGSLVITAPITRIAVYGATPVIGLHYSFKFVVTQVMKDNGIGIMITPFSSYTLEDTRLMIERFVVPT